MTNQEPIERQEQALERTFRQATVVHEVQLELANARKLHGPIRGYHEGYAVILEELDELWEIVKMNTHHEGGLTREQKLKMLRKEAIQIAAMAIRFVEDVCDRKASGGAA
jgi:small nuclear ribonucleoprotein (snRNP)-like protein